MPADDPARSPPWTRWTLDVRRGVVFDAQVRGPVLWLHLFAAWPGLPPVEVGRFRLDLGALEARNVVKRLLKEERPRYLVRVVRDARGVFHLARNDGASEPLDRHRVGADAVPDAPPAPRPPRPLRRPNAKIVRRERVTARRPLPTRRDDRPRAPGPRCRLCGAPAIPGDEVCLDCGS